MPNVIENGLKPASNIAASTGNSWVSGVWGKKGAKEWATFCPLYQSLTRAFIIRVACGGGYFKQCIQKLQHLQTFVWLGGAIQTSVNLTVSRSTFIVFLSYLLVTKWCSRYQFIVSIILSDEIEFSVNLC